MTPGSLFGQRSNIIMRLSASRLTVVRGGRIIFANLSFALERGDSLTVTGPNGAGKSSLLRALAGFLPLASGTVSLTPSSETLAENAHYVGHADGLKGLLTVAENLQFLAAILDAGHGGMPVGAALSVFGLSHTANLPLAYLSAGQKRRAALAKLLAVKRLVWILDEPLTALDAVSQKVMKDVMAAHIAQGGMIIAATHARLDLGGGELRLGADA
jgi:heme exporter protein A